MSQNKNKDVLIRPYHPNDKNEVIELLRSNTPDFFAASEEKDLDHYLENELDQYYVMHDGKQIVGCGGINIINQGAEARISWDIFHPAFQRKGLGSKLTLFRIEKIKSYPNVKKIIVRTTQVAYQFYQKLGFELLEIQKDFWAPGFDMYVMKYKS